MCLRSRRQDALGSLGSDPRLAKTLRLLNRLLVAAAIVAVFCNRDGFAAEPLVERIAKTSAQGARPVEVRLPSDWTHGLKVGPNGPIPVIVVDQFGYLTSAKKVAVIRDPKVGYDSFAGFSPGRRYALVELVTGNIVKEGPPHSWNSGATDNASGDRAWWFDFSDIVAPGKYAVADLERGVRSAAFVIGDDVYRQVMKHAGRVFYYQRAGYWKKPEFAKNAWADKASHLDTGQDAQSRPWPGAVDILARQGHSQVKDLRGGWYDAGDFNKYTSWTARNIIILLHAFDENPLAFADDWGIPESGNDVPDILDEMKWGLEWLRRMQNADGSVLCVQGLASASPPSAAKGPSYFGPATTSATWMTAAAFAYASKIFAKRPEAELKTFAVDLAKRAGTAWAWARANPSVVYFNNDDAKQPGSRGLASGQQEMNESDRRLAEFEAAVHLYEISSDSVLKSFIEANFSAIVPPYGPSQWDAEGQEALLYYARMSSASGAVKSAILEKFLSNIVTNPAVAAPNTSAPYRSPLKDITWGSNKSIAAQSRLLYLAAVHGRSEEFRAMSSAAAMEYAHYIHGVNPLGLVYLTNMSTAGAGHSANSMFHTWFAAGTLWERVQPNTPGPPPGYLVGGPNPSYTLDRCCTTPASTFGHKCGSPAAAAICKQTYAPPLGQPALKSYLQFSNGWPANSWAVTEPSTLYQATYIRALAPFVR
jgi:endoglucanase